MIEAFTRAWFANLNSIREKFAAKHPDNYKEVVRAVVQMLADASDEDENPDPDRIHEIDDGHYQGTHVYVIGAQGYQPSRYWYVKVSYGSCSGCDTLEGIRKHCHGQPDAEQVGGYMTLALHIVQGLREMVDS